MAVDAMGFGAGSIDGLSFELVDSLAATGSFSVSDSESAVRRSARLDPTGTSVPGSTRSFSIMPSVKKKRERLRTRLQATIPHKGQAEPVTQGNHLKSS